MIGFLSGTPDALLIALDPDTLAPLGVTDIGGDGSLIVEAKTIAPTHAARRPAPARARVPSANPTPADPRADAAPAGIRAD